MTDRPPSPVLAAVGLVVIAADGLRRLPHVLGSAGQAAARRYDEFAVRGQEVLAGHPHAAGPAQETAPSSAPGQAGGAGTVGGPADVTEPWVDEPAAEPGVAAEPWTVEEPAAGAAAEPWTVEEPASRAAAEPWVVDQPAEPEVVAEPGVVAEPALGAEPEAVAEPPFGRTEPVVLPEDVLEEVARMTPGADLAHDELPLADFDHQTVPQLRGRLRALGLAELVQLRDYEQAHAARLPVLTLLDNRIAKLLADTEQ